MFSGALNGVIAATTPTGTRIVNASRPSLPGVAATGISSPAIRTDSSADSRIVTAARVISVSASARVNPVSATYRARMRSRRAVSSRAAWLRISCRRAAGIGCRAAAAAAVTARSTSSGRASLTAAKGSRVYLSSTASSGPPAHHRPLIEQAGRVLQQFGHEPAPLLTGTSGCHTVAHHAMPCIIRKAGWPAGGGQRRRQRMAGGRMKDGERAEVAAA